MASNEVIPVRTKKKAAELPKAIVTIIPVVYNIALQELNELLYYFLLLIKDKWRAGCMTAVWNFIVLTTLAKTFSHVLNSY